MNADTIITIIYLLLETAFVVFLLALTDFSRRRANVWHFNLFLTFGLIFAYEYEVAREMVRLLNYCAVTAGPYREYYLRALDIFAGLFIREVILYAETKNSRVPTGRCH